jgi:peptidoglycan/LPS O-acetylase OafA/YrhL
VLGTLRLLLAISVSVFHATLHPGGFRYGVSGVVTFYMISGYAMSGLARAFMPAPDGGFWLGTARFWRDRILRLYPQYLFWLVAAAIVRFGFGRVWWSQQGPLDWVNVLGNLTALPLNMYIYIPSLSHMMIMPQAWTIATEFSFYALFPFIWRSPAVNWVFALGGVAVFALATHDFLPEDWFAYRLLPGTLPYFLIGRALYCRDRALLCALGALLALDFVLVLAAGKIELGYNKEIFTGLALGPLLLLGAVRIPTRTFDPLLGHTSYGAYLSHIAIILLCLDGVSGRWRIIGAVVLPTLAGFLSYWAVEVPVNRYRRSLRTKVAKKHVLLKKESKPLAH